jgi:hypothetical protein
LRQYFEVGTLVSTPFTLLALISGATTLTAADCAACHPVEAKLHSQSAHAAALMAPQGSPFVNHLSGKPLGEAADGYAFVYRQTLDGVDATAQRGSDSATAPIVWMFGSGRQGQTPVLSYHGSFIEHRVSYYTAVGYGITIGQENGVSPNAAKALGWVESASDAQKCFHCHSTSANNELTKVEPGVQCIRCHAGAEEHAQGRGKPVNPGKLDHLAQVQLCGECHRLKPVSGNERDIGNVRFQPLRLMKSACFRSGNIECTSCHPAHRDAQRDRPDVYNQACAGCHANQSAHVASERSTNCIGCHMPKVSPAPALTFTDHFIRVVSDKGFAANSR